MSIQTADDGYITPEEEMSTDAYMDHHMNNIGRGLRLTKAADRTAWWHNLYLPFLLEIKSSYRKYFPDRPYWKYHGQTDPNRKRKFKDQDLPALLNKNKKQ